MTYRELAHAAESRRMDEWDRTADIIAYLGSAWCGKELTREMFHPFREGMGQTKPNDDPEREHDRLVRLRQQRGIG